ncbi:beta-1,4-N-acetylgalactosaminyltransferase bre-4-like isoform X2 [Paramacrobiotus metropolitanus]|nr:beta-1,4-N-acetylgalactosaminyltransferase bre-4-like isoform X2 [Paramacrobiotus metropolitanus]
MLGKQGSYTQVRSRTVFRPIRYILGFIILLSVTDIFVTVLTGRSRVFLFFPTISLTSIHYSFLRPRIASCNESGCWQHSTFNADDIFPVFLPKCYPDGLLGKINPDKRNATETVLNMTASQLDPTGSWKPSDCQAKEKLAVIIPFRDRAEHLKIFLVNYHPIFQRQQLDYTVFVVEQNGTTTFNKGVLLNAGFLEAQKAGRYTCFIFHDVDLLPEQDNNMYHCSAQPRHLSVAVDKFNYTLPYKQLIGGASAFTVEQYTKVNGYSNSYWGWGGEDDDLMKRVELSDYEINRPAAESARYTMIKHEHDARNPENPMATKLLEVTHKRMLKDGLNNVEYRLLDLQQRHLYTWLLVDVGENRMKNITL